MLYKIEDGQQPDVRQTNSVLRAELREVKKEVQELRESHVRMQDTIDHMQAMFRATLSSRQVC